MTTAIPLTRLILEKVLEQTSLLDKLIERVEPYSSNWQPGPGEFSTAQLLEHLLESVAGFCAVLYAANPDTLNHFKSLREFLTIENARPDQVRVRLRALEDHIKEGFDSLNDSDLGRRIVTVFVPEGEPLLTLLLGNLEHLINHKHQLFSHLKLQGKNLTSSDLYKFRE